MYTMSQWAMVTPVPLSVPIGGVASYYVCDVLLRIGVLRAHQLVTAWALLYSKD